MRKSDLKCRCKKTTILGFSVICLVLALSACKSAKSLSKPAAAITENLDYLGSVANNTPTITNFSS